MMNYRYMSKAQVKKIKMFKKNHKIIACYKYIYGKQNAITLALELKNCDALNTIWRVIFSNGLMYPS